MANTEFSFNQTSPIRLQLPFISEFEDKPTSVIFLNLIFTDHKISMWCFNGSQFLILSLTKEFASRCVGPRPQNGPNGLVKRVDPIRIV